MRHKLALLHRWRRAHNFETAIKLERIGIDDLAIKLAGIFQRQRRLA
jgi:hypothetical protein